MPRNRLLKKEFFTDPKVGALPLGARLLFQSMWVNADDTGHGIADIRLLKAQAFPYDANISLEDIEGWLKQMVNARMVTLYEAAGEHYYEVRNFLKHQVISHPSKFEYPKPEHSDSTPVVLPEHFAPKSTVTSKSKSTKNEKENVTSKKAADAADGDRDRTLTEKNDFDLTEKADVDVRCARKVRGGQPVIMLWAGLDAKRFGCDVEPLFLARISSAFVRYRDLTHQHGSCDCDPAEYLDDLVRVCTEDRIRYPAGVLARLKELQRERERSSETDDDSYGVTARDIEAEAGITPELKKQLLAEQAERTRRARASRA
jgi:hypothetical protein